VIKSEITCVALVEDVILLAAGARIVVLRNVIKDRQFTVNWLGVNV
jgi:hypothetical protein